MHIKNLLILAMWLTLVTAACAQDNVALRVYSEKSDFLLGEPVIVYVKFTNTGAEPMNVSPNIGPEEDFCYYQITDPDGKTKTVSPLYVYDREEYVTLKTNESVTGPARIYYGGDGYYFPKPGRYSVVVEYQGVKSNTLDLTVKEPANDAQREQASLILDHPEVGTFLMLGGSDELLDARKQMDILNRKYPDGVLTSYLLAAEANNLARPARNFVTKKPREADFQRSIEILDKLKDKDLSFYFQHKVVGTLSRCYKETGKADSARVVLESFKRKLELNRELAPYLIKSVDEQIRKIR